MRASRGILIRAILTELVEQRGNSEGVQEQYLDLQVACQHQMRTKANELKGSCRILGEHRFFISGKQWGWVRG